MATHLLRNDTTGKYCKVLALVSPESITCVCASSPPILSRDLAVACSDYITTITLQHDVIARMALVPRTMEARGLDATPIIQAKLRKVGTPQALAAVQILEVILQEEVGHVAIGNHWYHWLCQRSHLDTALFYAQAAARYGAHRLKPPFNLQARRQAGFTEAEVNALAQVPPHGA